MNLVFLVVGISGVGKSTACQVACSTIQNSIHITASRFIEKEPILALDQHKLTRKIKSEIDKESNKVFLIDGHLTLKKFKVPLSAIKTLRIDYLIILTEKPEVIRNRRLKDIGKEREKESLNRITYSQEMEIHYGIHTAKKLNIPLFIIKNVYGDELSKVLKKKILEKK